MSSAPCLPHEKRTFVFFFFLPIFFLDRTRFKKKTLGTFPESGTNEQNIKTSLFFFGCFYTYTVTRTFFFFELTSTEKVKNVRNFRITGLRTGYRYHSG